MATYFIRVQRALDLTHGVFNVPGATPEEAEAEALVRLREGTASITWCEVQPPLIQDMKEDEDFFIMDCILIEDDMVAEEIAPHLEALLPLTPVVPSAEPPTEIPVPTQE